MSRLDIARETACWRCKAIIIFCLSLTVCERVWALEAQSSSNRAPARAEGETSETPAMVEQALESALNQGRYDQAQGLLRALLKPSGTSADIFLRAGIALAQRGLYDQAALAFRRCAEGYPDIFEAHYDLALAEFALGRYTQAGSTLTTAHPQSRREQLRLLYLRGKIANAEGRFAEARRDLATAFNGDPQEESYALDLGVYCLRHGAYPEATNIFFKARAFHPDSAYTGLGLALAEFLSERIPDAITVCKQLLAQQPTFDPARVLLAFAFYMKGDFRDAHEVASEGLRYSGPHPYVDYIDVASSLKLGSRDYNRMLAEVRTAEGAIPACSLCFLAESRIDDARGNRASAIRDLKQAVRLDPTFSDAWYRLAALYDQAGQHGKAVEARARFQTLRSTLFERQSEMLRRTFLQALSGE